MKRIKLIKKKILYGFRPLRFDYVHVYDCFIPFFRQPTIGGSYSTWNENCFWTILRPMQFIQGYVIWRLTCPGKIRNHLFRRLRKLDNKTK